MGIIARFLSLGPTEAGPLRAGGTLSVAEPGLARRIWLTLELIALFVAAPMAMTAAVHGYGAPLFLALLPILAIVLVLLLADRSFSLVAEIRRLFDWRAMLSILVVFAVIGAIVAKLVADIHPSLFLEFPTNRPGTWQRIMLLYPFASVATQELVYRTFYFHRYGPLFGRQRWLAILINAVLFGFAHIVVGNWFAVLTTFASGLLFALRYSATRSFWAVLIEHTIWGWLVFTVGLGRFFFTGVASVR